MKEPKCDARLSVVSNHWLLAYFALPTDKMTVNNFYVQNFRTKDTEPVYVKNYRLPQKQKEEINNQVNKLLANDLIEPSMSSFNSPLILVSKKSTNGVKKWRMCVDYRLPNEKKTHCRQVSAPQNRRHFR